MAVQSRSGTVSVSVLAMVVVGAISGIVLSLLISGHLANQLVLAFICALVAAILALVVGRLIFGWATAVSMPPGVVLWNVVISSIIGGLAGHELSVDLRNPPAPPLVGGISGVLTSLLIVSFVITIFVIRYRHADTRN